jgi:choice-of-anchor C domain-containing protein
MNLVKLATGGAAAAMLLTSLTASAAPVSLVSNGSFENGIPNTGLFTTLTAPDSASITNWTVSKGNVDYIDTYWKASDGKMSLDMNGTEPGAVTQNLVTKPGHMYTVFFDMAGNPDGGTSAPAVKTMTVDAGGTPQTYSFDTTGHTDASMGWVTKAFLFKATSTSTPLTFTSTTGGTNPSFGPALDNVRAHRATAHDCKKGGWQTFTNPTFKNQGACVSYFVHQNSQGDQDD